LACELFMGSPANAGWAVWRIDSRNTSGLYASPLAWKA